MCTCIKRTEYFLNNLHLLTPHSPTHHYPTHPPTSTFYLRLLFFSSIFFYYFFSPFIFLLVLTILYLNTFFLFFKFGTHQDLNYWLLHLFGSVVLLHLHLTTQATVASITIFLGITSFGYEKIKLVWKKQTGLYQFKTTCTSARNINSPTFQKWTISNQGGQESFI